MSPLSFLHIIYTCTLLKAILTHLRIHINVSRHTNTHTDFFYPSFSSSVLYYSILCVTYLSCCHSYLLFHHIPSSPPSHSHLPIPIPIHTILHYTIPYYTTTFASPHPLTHLYHLSYNTTPHHTTLHHTQASATRGSEEPGSRGRYVRTGDRIILQTASSDNHLSLYEDTQVCARFESSLCQ